MLFTGLGWAVLGKTVPEVSSTVLFRGLKHLMFVYFYDPMQARREGECDRCAHTPTG